jgi:hypothetical protein
MSQCDMHEPLDQSHYPFRNNATYFDIKTRLELLSQVLTCAFDGIENQTHVIHTQANHSGKSTFCTMRQSISEYKSQAVGFVTMRILTECLGWTRPAGPWPGPAAPTVREGRFQVRGIADDYCISFRGLTSLRLEQLDNTGHPRLIILIKSRDEFGCTPEPLARRPGLGCMFVLQGQPLDWSGAWPYMSLPRP